MPKEAFNRRNLFGKQEVDMNKDRIKQLIDRYENADFTVNRRLNAMIRERLSDDLTLDQYATLRYIRKNGPQTSSELSDIFCVGKSSITAIITRLSDKRLIKRVPDQKDRRVTNLSLTPEGERVTDEIGDKIQELLAKYLGEFDDTEANVFIETYEKLASVLVQPIEGSGKKE
jgi:DNA-binding MarR family transcriptional regulator